MEVIRIDDLRYLIENQKEPSISMYMPTEPGDKDKNRITFKNSISKAKEMAKDKGFNSADLEKSIKSFTTMAEDLEFLVGQREGLAVFINDEGVKLFRLPHKFQEAVMVDKIFHIKPLMPIITEDTDYFILSLSKNQVKLYEVNRFEINHVEIEGLPKDMDDALQYDISEVHFGKVPQKTGSVAQKGISTYHGHGIGDETEKEFILRYCQVIEKFISGHIKGKNRPLVIAGVDYIQAIYKEASSFEDILTKGISGNPDMMTPDDLRKEGWELIRPEFTKFVDKAKKIYGNMSGSDKVSESVHEIVKASRFQRIDTLFLSMDAPEVLGVYDEENNFVNSDNPNDEKAEDLIGMSVRQTLLNGGKIYYVPQSEMPNKHHIGAILRY